MKGDTPVNSTMSVGQARKLVEQLKIEASFCRIKVRGAESLSQGATRDAKAKAAATDKYVSSCDVVFY